MSTTLVPVMQRGALGYPENASRGDKDTATYTPLSEALVTTYPSDAHFSAYALPELPRRLATDDALGLGAAMVLFVVDVDGADTDASGQHVATSEWWEAEQAKIATLVSTGAFVYRTRGGYRIVYRLAESFPLDTIESKAKWRASYLVWLRQLQEAMGISGDPKCQDWTRLYRLPRVARDGVLQDLEVFGDPEAIGIWDLPMTEPVATTPISVPRVSTPVATETSRDAAARLLGAAWAPVGSRHEAHKALSGALARAGWDADTIADFTTLVAETATPGSGDRDKRIGLAHRAVAMIAADQPTTGWTTLGDHVEKTVIDRVRGLLGFNEPPSRDTPFLKAMASVLPPPPQKQVPPPAATPTRNQIMEAVKAARNAARSRRKSASDQMAASLLDKVFRGEFITESSQPEEHNRVELKQAVMVTSMEVPPGTTHDQLMTLLVPCVSGGYIAELPGMITEAMASRPSESAEDDEFSQVGEPGQFTLDSKTGKPYASQHNVETALQKMRIRFDYDLLSEQEFITGFNAEPRCKVKDRHIDELWLRIEKRYSFCISADKFVKITTSLAHANAFHPVIDYLDSLVWDGVSRIGGGVEAHVSWLTRYGGAPNNEYVRAVGRLVLLAAVRRIRDPGSKFDEMMILESKQGTNKSSVLEVLAVREEWFGNSVPLNADSQRQMEGLAGKWIIEAGELKGMDKSEINTLKSFLSQRSDSARQAYGRKVETRPRQCVFIGTTNDKEYLEDPTGNRRFWPVEIDVFDLEKFRADRDHLWAEAAHYEALGEPIRLDPALYDVAEEEQARRKIENPWVSTIASWASRLAKPIGASPTGLIHHKLEEIAKGALNIEIKDIQKHTKQIVTALREAGFVETKVRRGDDAKRQRYWTLRRNEGVETSREPTPEESRGDPPAVTN